MRVNNNIDTCPSCGHERQCLPCEAKDTELATLKQQLADKDSITIKDGKWVDIETVSELERQLKEKDLHYKINSDENRQRIEYLEKQVEEKDEEIEIQAWNLGGCSTLALGYDTDKEFSKEMARAALYDVQKLRRDYDLYKSIMGEVKEALGEITKFEKELEMNRIHLTTFSTNWFKIVDMAKSALTLLTTLEKREEGK